MSANDETRVPVPGPGAKPTATHAPDRPPVPSGADPATAHAAPEPVATIPCLGPPPAFDAPVPPVAAGRYVLGAEIARGGMGAVYRATDTAFGREVAVKVLQEKFGSEPGAARRFADEARITGQLQHPAIPPVHDVGTLHDGRPFLAMKLIKGDTLDELLRARPDPATERGRFVAAFEQVCQAVAYAHAHDVIHRDLKPANVMVGAFGEVQVMDWGLAKVLVARDAATADPDETVGGTAIQSLRESDSSFTQAGSVLGTPAFMPPEQAIGAVNKVDARSDVFGLGAILAVILTGKPPFSAGSGETMRLLAAQGNVEECFARLDASGAEPELVSLCKRCLSKKPGDRPADAGEVAKAVAELRAAAHERARQAELDRVQAEGDKVAAELRVEGERQKAEEQRKRRRVQLALAGFVVLVAVVGGIVAIAMQREADRRAGEKQRALTDALTTAETAAVPRVVKDLAEYRDLIGARLRELAGQPIGTKPGLHARLALLADEPARAEELAAYLPVCRLEELLTIRDALRPHAGAVAPGLWAVLTNAKADAGMRVRAACALAGLAPNDERWTATAPSVADLVVLESPLAAAVWFEALEPIRGALVPALVKRYPEAQGRLRGGKLDEMQLAAEVFGFELTATALVRYTQDRPADAAELVVLADPRHYTQFFATVQSNKAAAVPVLKAELTKTGQADWTDAQHETLDRRRAQAAAVLLTLGEAEPVWPLFTFPKDGDPSARSYLLARLNDREADPVALIRRFEVEPDVSAKRALLVALGGFPVDVVPAAEREAMSKRLLVLYREHPDPGLHGALDWVLRQKWGKAKELAVIDRELASAARAGMAQGKDWFVNGEGQTYAVVRGPVEFTQGSPQTELGRNEYEPPHRKRIGRTFAVGTKEVTVEQFLRFRPEHDWPKRSSPGPDTPAVSMTWYEAAEYCNWLSKREGIPPDQWCYEPNEKGQYAVGMRIKTRHLALTGYRLPTEAEWEFACRSGAVTSRYYGRGVDLLPRYGWFARNAEDRAWPVGQLRPNELGLFDVLGNALEWVEDPAALYVVDRLDDIENAETLRIDELTSRLLRGGSFRVQPTDLRSAFRDSDRPGYRDFLNGFRPVRTLPRYE